MESRGILGGSGVPRQTVDPNLFGGELRLYDD